MAIPAVMFWTLWTVFVFLVVFNFMPAVIGYVTGHPDRHMLALLNIVSLFSFVLWIALFTWARTRRRDHPIIARYLGTPADYRRSQLAALTVVAATFGTLAWSFAIA